MNLNSFPSNVIFVGVARGCGWQKIGACVNLGAYYLVGIPSAYLIAFVLRVGGTVRISFSLQSPNESDIFNFHKALIPALGTSWLLLLLCTARRTGPVVGHHLWALGASPAANDRHAVYELG